MSKKQDVLEHLEKGKAITSWEAIKLFKATRLADIVFKLKQYGHKIDTHYLRNESGVRYAVYQLKRG